MADIFEALARMPKAELHMHIEGSLEPEMMLKMGSRNGVDLPWNDVEAVREAYRFNNLQDFLAIFYTGLSVLVLEEDFFDVTLAYLRRAHQDNVVHAELFISPQAHLRRGVAFETMMRGVTRAFDVARADFAMGVKLIVLFQRHLPEDDAFPIIDMVEPWRDTVVGFGLAGAEVGNPPSKFERVFGRCRSLGYKVVAHAGEEGPASYVRDTLDLLKVDRVDHGVRAADDPVLVARLARERIPLTVCPMANVRLGVFPSFAEHNLGRLLEQGVMVTVNSDDPSYFSAYMNEILRQCVSELGLSYKAILKLVENSFNAAFIPVEQKAAYIARLDEFRRLKF